MSFFFLYFALCLFAALSNINSWFFAAQQGDCSQPNRTNMRFFVSPSLTTRTSPNWCRRWTWLRWEIASPWHMPVSIRSVEADYICLHCPRSVCSACSSIPSVCLSTSQRALNSKTCASYNRIYYLFGVLQRLACFRLYELLRGTAKVSFFPRHDYSVILRSISAAAVEILPS